MGKDLRTATLQILTKVLEPEMHKLITQRFERYLEGVHRDPEHMQHIIVLSSPMATVKVGTKSLARRILSRYMFSDLFEMDKEMIDCYFLDRNQFRSLFNIKLTYIFLNIYSVLVGLPCDLEFSQCNKGGEYVI